AGLDAAFAMLMDSNFWLSAAVSGFIYIAVFTILIVQIDAVGRDAELSPGKVLTAGLKRVVPMIVLTLLYFALTVFGFALAIVPGIYWGGVFQLAFIPLVVENAGVVASFGISKQLIKGHWWRVSSIVAVGLIIPMLADPLATLVSEVFAALLR